MPLTTVVWPLTGWPTPIIGASSDITYSTYFVPFEHTTELSIKCYQLIINQADMQLT